MKINNINILAISVICLAISCQIKQNDNKSHHSLMEKIKTESKQYTKPYIIDNNITDKNLVIVKEKQHHFLVPDRKNKILAYKCSECHNKPMPQLKNKTEEIAHWDIKIMHATKETMNCFTCHGNDNMDELESLTNKKIDFNRSDKLCSQCHTQEHKDWLGGAHGKRKTGWAYHRISKTCVECHNPHNPQYKSRWPSRYNTTNNK